MSIHLAPDLESLQQPVADNLRCVAAVMKIAWELECVADHATNIAEDVVYLVEGEIIRHRPEFWQQ